MKIKTLICVMGMLLPMANIFAQDRDYILKGRITNTNNNPLEGASLLLQKARAFHTSGDSGSFTLHFFHSDTLLVSHIGYTTRKIAVTSTTNDLLIRLQPSLALDSVVVSTGYQTIPKERATGSFEVIDSKMLNQRTTTNILDRLEGVSSVLFDKGSSRQGTSMTIRGVSSIYGSKTPLVVVDNFPYEGDMENINPNDVENITFLKDAAAASIWGTKAGNGVIVITTKKGKMNQPMAIYVNANLVMQAKPDIFYLQSPFINSPDFIDMEKMLFANGYYNSKINSSSKPALSPVVEILLRQRNGELSAEQADEMIAPLRNYDIRKDFEKYVYKASVRQQYSIGLTGGAGLLSYNFSVGWDKNKDELSATYNRLTLKAASQYRITQRLDFSTSILFSQSNSASGMKSYTDLFSGQYFYPYARLADDNGDALPVNYQRRRSFIDTAGGGSLMDWKYYPLEDYKHNTSHIGIQNLLALFSLKYRVNSFASIDIQYQHEYQNTKGKTLYGMDSYFTRDLINQFTVVNRTMNMVTYKIPEGDILDPSFTSLNADNIRGLLNINKTLAKSNLSGLIGGEIRQIRNEWYQYRIYGYSDDILTFGNVDYTNAYANYLTGAQSYIPNNMSVGRTNNRYVSLFANAAYSFKNRYILSGSARRDASNLFGVGTNDKWNPFWSTGGSWLVSEEPFYKIPILPYLKLRLTYGVSGNVDQSKSSEITMRYLGSSYYNNYTYGNIYQFGNPELRWEKVYTANLGVDFKSKNEIASGAIDAYVKKGKDLFGQAPVDYTSVSALTQIINSANSITKGVDISINFKLLENKNINWHINLIASYSNNKITKFLGTDTVAKNFVNGGNSPTPLVGKPVYSVTAYKYGGLDENGDPLGYLNSALSKDYAQIEYQHYSTLKYMGSALPKYYGSLAQYINLKNLDISLGISYKLGYYFTRPSIYYSSLFNNGIGHSDFYKRWQNPGDEHTTSIPGLKYPLETYRDDFFSNSEFLATKGDHIRLQFITIGYNFSEKQSNNILKNCRFFVSGNNILLIWKANHNGIDPDYTTSPPLRNFSVGVTKKIE